MPQTDNREAKVARLLAWNRKSNTTFAARARDARAIVTGDDMQLDMLLDATGA